MISARKSIILRVIFDVDFSEVSAGIGIKFINIIRYNPEVGKKPKFYHLKLKNFGNGDYEYLNFQEVMKKLNKQMKK